MELAILLSPYVSIPRTACLIGFVFTYCQEADSGVAGRHALSLLRSQEEFSLLFHGFFFVS